MAATSVGIVGIRSVNEDQDTVGLLTKLLFVQMLLGFSLGAFVWNLNEQIWSVLLNKWPSFLPFGSKFTAGLNIVGAVIFAIPALRYFNNSSLRKDAKLAACIVVVS